MTNEWGDFLDLIGFNKTFKIEWYNVRTEKLQLEDYNKRRQKGLINLPRRKGGGGCFKREVVRVISVLNEELIGSPCSKNTT